MRLSKWLYVFAVGALLLSTGAGCSGDGISGPSSGSVLFKIDAQTCTGSGTITFFIDGSAVGTETLSTGATSKAYTTTAGQHIVGAREGTSGYTWPSQTVTVPAGSTYTALLECT